MHYLFLTLAIVLEIIATTLLKYSEGFTKLVPTLGCIAFYTGCFYLFSKSLAAIELGVAYATWCSAGIVLTTVVSVLLFGQKLNLPALIGIVLIIAGCVILNLFGNVSH